MSKEAMKLRTAAEKVVELCSERPLSLGKWFIDMSEACESLREALAEQPAQQEFVSPGGGYVPAIPAQQALDKMAEHARELGLDYEPAKDNSNYRFDPPGLDPSHQKPVTPTAVEMQNAAANLALMREMWGNSDEPAAKVNDDGFIVETGLLLSPGTQLYTSPPAQRKPLTDGELADLWYKQSLDWMEFARAIEAAHNIKENT